MRKMTQPLGETIELKEIIQTLERNIKSLSDSFNAIYVYDKDMVKKIYGNTNRWKESYNMELGKLNALKDFKTYLENKTIKISL